MLAEPPNPRLVEVKMFPESRSFLKAATVVAGLVALAACTDDRGVNPMPSQVEAEPMAATTSTTPVAEYAVLVGQQMRIVPQTSLRLSRVRWSTSNASAATVNSTGTVTGVAAGTATVAVSAWGFSQSYLVRVSAPAPTLTSFAVTPATGTALAPGQTRQFTSTAVWSDGQTRASTVTYTATGGTISSGGLFTAGSVAGTFMVIASCSCATPAISDTALVSVEVPAQLTKLTVSPKTVSVAAGASQQFAVAANWSTGATTVPPVTWSATGGTVSSTGAYVAPATAGTYRVIVAHTGGTVRDTAVVTVTSGTSTTTTTTTAGTPWSIVRDFNSGALGTVAQRTADGFDDIAGSSIYSAQQRVDGTNSAMLSIDSGATGFGRWGGSISFPTKLVAGDEVWVDVNVFFPNDFVLTTDVGHLKFLRIHTKNAAGANAGYNDLYIADEWRTGYDFRFIKEGQNQWYNHGVDGSFARGKWHRFSIHLQFDSLATSAGGRSRVRVWQNGALLLDEGRIQSLSSATDYSDRLLLFTYWNGASPKAQNVWVDNLRVSNFRPAWASTLQGG